MNSHSSLVVQAVQHYRRGDFKQALHYYQQAAQKYGQHLFKANLQLCKQKINGTKHASLPVTTTTPAQVNGDSNLVLQLQETQKLLEHYYNRTQELEYQLLDR
ncbi:hypothetical protein ACU6RQ_08060 [Zobellella denitrificans]